MGQPPAEGVCLLQPRMAGQPGIRHRHQQVEVGIGPGGAAGAGVATLTAAGAACAVAGWAGFFTTIPGGSDDAVFENLIVPNASSLNQLLGF